MDPVIQETVDLTVALVDALLQHLKEIHRKARRCQSSPDRVAVGGLCVEWPIDWVMVVVAVVELHSTRIE